jgi:vancomycin resistance protein YoaR
MPPLDGPGIASSAVMSRAERLRKLAASQRLAAIASRLALAAAILVMLGAAGLYAFRTTYDGRIYPSVYVSSMDLSGKSYAEAQSLLDARAAQIAATQASFTSGGKTWTPTLQQLGVSVDAASSLDEAYAVGRESGARARLASAFGVAHGTHSIALKVDLNQATLNQWFDLVDRDINQAPKNATLSVVDGKVVVEQSVDGVVVDRAQATAMILSTLKSMGSFQGALPTKVIPAAIHSADLQGVQSQLTAALAQPVKLTFGKKHWTLTASDLGQFVIVGKDGVGNPSVTLDKDGLSTWLSKKISGEVNSEPVDAKVAWGGDDVGLTAVEPSHNGARLKPSTLAENVIASFFSNHASIEVPVTWTSPKIDSNNLGALGITTKLSVGDSSFEGSDAGRENNIEVGISLLNGTLVPPGALFSFNHAIGEITADKGYTEAAIVDGQAIGRDIGGGICQVSTTTFRAAFFAGFQSEERWAHRYRFPFYELDGWTPGLDASILQPEGNPFGGGDYSFWNPSDSAWLLIEAYVDAPHAYVIIYGPDLGWTVKVSDPEYGSPSDVVKQPPDQEVVDDTLEPGTVNMKEYGLSSSDVSYERTVTDRDGNIVRQDSLYSHYYERATLWAVSPDMKGQSPAGTGATTIVEE